MRFVVIERGTNSFGDLELSVLDTETGELLIESFPEGHQADWFEYQQQLNGME